MNRDDRPLIGDKQGRDKIAQIQLQVDDVKEVMVTNIDKAIKRGDDLDVLQQKTSDLEKNAGIFERDARSLKRRMWWKNIRIILAIIIIVLIVAIVLGLIIWSTTKN